MIQWLTYKRKKEFPQTFTARKHCPIFWLLPPNSQLGQQQHGQWILFKWSCGSKKSKLCQYTSNIFIFCLLNLKTFKEAATQQGYLGKQRLQRPSRKTWVTSQLLYTNMPLLYVMIWSPLLTQSFRWTPTDVPNINLNLPSVTEGSSRKALHVQLSLFQLYFQAMPWKYARPAYVLKIWPLSWT